MSDELGLIAAEVRACRLCRLHQTARNGVPGEGNPNAEVLFVGEGPGAHEDQQGRPFVGPAGQLLNDLLARAGLRREEVFITNIVKHRPPGNRDPELDEKAACEGFLERQIEAISPLVIVTLGRHSMAKFFGPNARISTVHGTTVQWNGRVAYACFHPAAALHQPRYKQAIEDDFAGLRALLERLRSRKPTIEEPDPDDTPEQLSLL